MVVVGKKVRTSHADKSYAEKTIANTAKFGVLTIAAKRLRRRGNIKALEKVTDALKKLHYAHIKSKVRKLSSRGEVQESSALRERKEKNVTETKDEKALREWRESFPKDWVKPTPEQIEIECEKHYKISLKAIAKLDEIKKQNKNFDIEFFGKHILMNIDTGEFISADSEQEAKNIFKKCFGDNVLNLHEHIGFPVYVRDPAGILF